jgi:hypothetical protein
VRFSREAAVLATGASDARDGCATRAGGFTGSTWVLETSDPNPGVFACVVVTRAGLCRARRRFHVVVTLDEGGAELAFSWGQ